MNLQANQAVTERSSEFHSVSGVVVARHWWKFIWLAPLAQAVSPLS